MAASPTSPSTLDAAASERRSPVLQLTTRQLEDALLVALPNSARPQLLEGVRDGGFTLPKDWYSRALLADLSSALEFLSSVEDKPQTHARAISQIRGTLTALR